MKSYLTSHDYEAQSYAAYNIICSNSVFTTEYQWAHNCISTMATHRNDFQAIYRIASEVIPALNNTPIPNNPPTFDESQNIYDYEKVSRNYWVLKFIMYYIHVPKSKFVAICNTIEGKHKQMQISYSTVYLTNHIFHPLWCHEMFIFIFAKFLIAKNWAKYVSHLILSLSLWCCLVP